MKRESKLIHTGDRKKAGDFIPSATPIYTASSYFYDSMDQLDRVLGRQEEGPCYARYDNPTTSALEELVNDLEGGHGTVATVIGHERGASGGARGADRSSQACGVRQRDLWRDHESAR